MANYEKGIITNENVENLSTTKWAPVENEAGYKNGDATSAGIIKCDDGYHMTINDEIQPTVLRVREYEEGKCVILLEPNVANRKYFHVNKMTEDKVVLTYKEAIKIGSSSKIPNEKLIEYLDEADKAEYLAIIDRAKAAMDAAKPAEMTEEEKLRAKIAKMQAKLAELQG
jgi:hypothetical protein